MIVADDYGLGALHDRAMQEMVACGAIDAVSVLVEFCTVDSAHIIRDSGCKIGLHFNLTLSRGEKKKYNRGHLLIYSAFGFYATMAQGELQRQLDQFIQLFGRLPDFIDGHEHCHAYPSIARVVLATAQQHAIPVRITALGRFYFSAKSLVIGWLGWRMRRMAQSQGLHCNRLFFGIMPLDKAPDAAAFMAELARYRNAVDAIMMVHPGDDCDPVQVVGHRAAWRKMEYNILKETAKGNSHAS